jgi:aryl-alcohol dehydrogenase-like predicted oxidoreductase
MRMRRFGSTSYEVSAIGLGAMPLSLEGRPSEAAGVKVVHAALDAGMRLIDTADVYCIDDRDIGHNERLVAKALREWGGDRSSVLVATKGGLERPGGAWTSNASREHLRDACEKSLRALGVERIALYQLHSPDDDVPFADSVGELARLRDEGKVEHVGLSNVDTDELAIARAIVPIVSVQNRLNPFDLKSVKNGVVAACEAGDLAFLPYSPVGGWSDRQRIGNDRTLAKVASAHEATVFEIALAWILTLSPAMIPIPGASKIKSATSSAKAASIELTTDDVAELDRAFKHER